MQRKGFCHLKRRYGLTASGQLKGSSESSVFQLKSKRLNASVPQASTSSHQASKSTENLSAPLKTVRINFDSRRIARLVFYLAVIIIIVAVIWLAVAGIRAVSKVTDRRNDSRSAILNLNEQIKPDQIKTEGGGRVNILLIGVGGTNHPGGTLADTLILASFDHLNQKLSLISIPRDLYVPISSGGYSKINAVHSTGEQLATSKNKSNKLTTVTSGPALLKETVTKILDLPIHYYVRADFQALQKVVDTLGGVTVDVENPIVDLSYPADNMVDYSPFRLAAGVQTLDGKTALRYARSRHSGGAEGSDFARAKRQQKLIDAIQQKALKIGFLANPKKLNDLIGILGDHVRTDLSLKEAERIVEVSQKMDKMTVNNLVLDNGNEGILYSTSGDQRGYILLPKNNDYTQVARYIHRELGEPYLKKEAATITLINRSGKATQGNAVVQYLADYGYKVTEVAESSSKRDTKTSLTMSANNLPFTEYLLEKRLKAEAVRAKNDWQTDFVIYLGSDFVLPVVSVPGVAKATPVASLSPSPAVSPLISSPQP